MFPQTKWFEGIFVFGRTFTFHIPFSKVILESSSSFHVLDILLYASYNILFIRRWNLQVGS